MTLYITLTEALVIHRQLIRRYSGADGLRDLGALEAVLYRPQSGHYRDVIHEAAALFESLAMNHPFIDGNKRVAFACLDVFLRVNGLRLNLKSTTIFKWMMANLEADTFTISVIEPWLRKNAKQI